MGWTLGGYKHTYKGYNSSYNLVGAHWAYPLNATPEPQETKLRPIPSTYGVFTCIYIPTSTMFIWGVINQHCPLIKYQGSLSFCSPQWKYPRMLIWLAGKSPCLIGDTSSKLLFLYSHMLHKPSMLRTFWRSLGLGFCFLLQNWATCKNSWILKPNRIKAVGNVWILNCY